MYTEINRFPEPKRSELQKLLDEGVYSLSELYNNFIVPYGLLRSALAAFQIHENCPRATLLQLWNNILSDDEYPNLQALKTELVQLGKEYFNSEVIFPLDTMVVYLEQISLTKENLPGWSRQWVLETLLEIGYKYATLFKIYSRLIEKEECSKEDKIHLAYVTQILIRQWIDWLALPNCSPHERNALKNLRVESTVQKIIESLQDIKYHRVSSYQPLIQSFINLANSLPK